MAGYSDFGLCAQNNTSLTYRPSLQWGRTRILVDPFLSPARAGSDTIKAESLRWQDTSNAKSLGEDLTAPQGVTRQNVNGYITQHNSSKGKGAGNKITVGNCLLSFKPSNGLENRDQSMRC